MSTLTGRLTALLLGAARCARWRAALGSVLAALITGCGEAPPPAPEAASLPRARLLTAEQYANTIADIFGADIADSVIPPLPPLARTDGLLASGAAFVGLTSDQLSQIQQAAATISALVVDEDHRHFLLPCSPESEYEADSTCARQFLKETADLLYRRPIADERVGTLVALADRAAEQTGDFYEGLALALEAVLISPEVLLIVDRTEPAAEPENAVQSESTGTASAAPEFDQLDAWSLASRLSYFLWNAPPDAELLEAAASGALRTAEGLERQVDRLLSSPRLEVGMRAFFDDMLAFDEFDSLAKDPMVYPMVTGATLADAREQTLRTVIDHLLDQEADYRDLFTTRETFMSMPLAAVYGVPSAGGWEPFEFEADGPRMGLLTHLSFLSAHSHPVRSSPTLRGKALRELLLCQKVPDPPPNVDFSAIEDAGEVATARERLAVHNSNPSCAGCHLITDPMGLSLENFDGAGRYRETENGAELDIAGELDGVFYEDIAGLATALRNHPKLSYCLVNRLYAYGTGGPVSLRHERDVLKWFERRFVDNGHQLRALLKDLATSDAFTRVRASEAKPGTQVATNSSDAPSVFPTATTGFAAVAEQDARPATAAGTISAMREATAAEEKLR